MCSHNAENSLNVFRAKNNVFYRKLVWKFRPFFASLRLSAPILMRFTKSYVGKLCFIKDIFRSQGSNQLSRRVLQRLFSFLTSAKQIIWLLLVNLRLKVWPDMCSSSCIKSLDRCERYTLSSVWDWLEWCCSQPY